jgi:hypothetical protein
MITVIAILAVTITIAGIVIYTLSKGNNFPFITPTYTKEELENIKLAEELYNKDLRPVVAKKSKLAPELEVVEPEFVEKIVKISKVFPEDALINLEEVKPVKKKRKYYPKKKK